MLHMNNLVKVIHNDDVYNTFHATFYDFLSSLKI